MTRSALLGVDLGTSAVKVLLLDPEHVNEPIAEAGVELQVSMPRPGWSEQDPDDWWRGVCVAVRSVMQRADTDGWSVAALAVSGQMHGATLLDASGGVVRPCILWNDQRSAPQCVAIRQAIGLPALIEWVGNPALPGFTAPKLLWVREHEPDLWGQTRTVLLPKDYINFRLTGELATEVSDASGTLLFDVARRRWSDRMLDALALPASILPPVKDSTNEVGKVTAEAADATGLPMGTPVIAGGADNACAAIGSGVLHAGDTMVSVGTSGTVLAPIESPRADPQARLHTFCHAVPDTWYLMGVVLSAGASLRWFRDTLAAQEHQQAVSRGDDVYAELMSEAARVGPGSEGLIFLPYLTGERTPHADPDARGVFFGLSPRHGRGHLVRSLVEGVTYALADSLQLMRDLGLRPNSVQATGGGARSELWTQVIADVFGEQVVPRLGQGGPSVGAAIIAGVGANVFSSFGQATSLLSSGRAVSPHQDVTGLYGRYRAVFQGLYPALRDQFHELAHLAQH